MNDNDKIPESVILRTVDLLATRTGISAPAAEQRVRDFAALIECMAQAGEEHEA